MYIYVYIHRYTTQFRGKEAAATLTTVATSSRTRTSLTSKKQHDWVLSRAVCLTAQRSCQTREWDFLLGMDRFHQTVQESKVESLFGNLLQSKRLVWVLP